MACEGNEQQRGRLAFFPASANPQRPQLVLRLGLPSWHHPHRRFRLPVASHTLARAGAKGTQSTGDAL